MIQLITVNSCEEQESMSKEDIELIRKELKEKTKFDLFYSITKTKNGYRYRFYACKGGKL